MRTVFMAFLAGCGGAVTIEESAEWEAVRSESVRVTCDEAGEVVLGTVTDGAIVQVFACGGGDCDPVTWWRMTGDDVRVDCGAPGDVYRMDTLTPIVMRQGRHN